MNIREVRDVINAYARRRPQDRRAAVQVTFSVKEKYQVHFSDMKPRGTIATFKPFFVDALIDAGGFGWGAK